MVGLALSRAKIKALEYREGEIGLELDGFGIGFADGELHLRLLGSEGLDLPFQLLYDPLVEHTFDAHHILQSRQLSSKLRILL